MTADNAPWERSHPLMRLSVARVLHQPTECYQKLVFCMNVFSVAVSYIFSDRLSSCSALARKKLSFNFRRCVLQCWWMGSLCCLCCPARSMFLFVFTKYFPGLGNKSLHHRTDPRTRWGIYFSLPIPQWHEITGDVFLALQTTNSDQRPTKSNTPRSQD